MKHEGQVQRFSPADAEKIASFKSTVSAANRAEQMVLDGKRVPVVTLSANGDRTTESLSNKHVSNMKHAAFELYVDYLHPDNKLRPIANNIVTAEKAKVQAKREQKQTEITALNTVWETAARLDHERTKPK